MNSSPTVVIVVVTALLCLPFVRLMNSTAYHPLPQVHTGATR